MGFRNDSFGSDTPVSASELGQSSGAFSGSRDDSQQGSVGAAEFWNNPDNDGLRQQLGLSQKPQPPKPDAGGISQEDIHSLLALQQAIKSGNKEEILKLAGMTDPNDPVANMQSELEQLRSKLEDTNKWKEEFQKSEMEKQRSQQQQDARQRVFELFNRDEFGLLNKYGQQDLVWQLGEQHLKDKGTPPTARDWMEYAVRVENELISQVQGFQSLEMPLEKLELERVLGVQGDRNTPQQPASNAPQGSNRPTLSNSGSPQIAPASSDDGILSVSDRIKKGLEAARRLGR